MIFWTPKWTPKWAQNRLGVILGPKLAQEPQDSPKTAPRWPKMAQDAHKMAQDAPRCAKMGPRRAQDSPKIRPNGPKIAPRWHSWAVLGSPWPPWAFLKCSSCSAEIALQLLLNTLGSGRLSAARRSRFGRSLALAKVGRARIQITISSFSGLQV